MSFTLIALAIGLVIALALGGRPRHLASRHFRLWWLLPAGVLLQALLERSGVPGAFGLLLVSYACLLAFGLANVRITGMWLVVLGFGLNALVIAVDHGMPVSRSALRSLHTAPTVHEVKHHVADDSDHLRFLCDIIPVPPIDEVLSFGDLILAVGICDVLVHLMRPARPRARGSAKAPAGQN